jgi:hypothetical protein
MRRAMRVKEAVREAVSLDRLWMVVAAGMILAAATLLSACI